MHYGTKNLSTLFTYIFLLNKVPYLMFEIELIGYMDCGTKNLSTLFTYIFWLYRVPYLMFEIEIIGCKEQEK